ncbi:hypothetical protein [Aggregatibacter sp. Marseille-P9115]|jgi:hypothetical protein|uniref:hypothetical protein n=1 Tax=Aggregatibacter sp. Marseille-P9115 TaxID=2866570 RepID=UPI001E54C976|nr:hypothetical protein [Aggregatibacter sp. Marseille-P9115]
MSLQTYWENSLEADHHAQIEEAERYEVELEAEKSRIDEAAKNGDESLIDAINNAISLSDDDLNMQWLAIGTGAWDKLADLRDNAIAIVAKRNLGRGMA